MNILLRHTLASIARNPVQSVIIMISTAMITACVLVCLCISSLFEQLTSLWGTSRYGGADLIITGYYATEYGGVPFGESLRAYSEEHSDEIAAVLATYESSLSVMSSTETVRAYGIIVEDLDRFDSLTGAEILSRCENTSDLPSAHVSLAFAQATDLSLGETFTTKNGSSYFISAICNNTSRYFDSSFIVFAAEGDFSDDAGAGDTIKKADGSFGGIVLYAGPASSNISCDVALTDNTVYYFGAFSKSADGGYSSTFTPEETITEAKIPFELKFDQMQDGQAPYGWTGTEGFVVYRGRSDSYVYAEMEASAEGARREAILAFPPMDFPDKGYEIHTGDTQTLPSAPESPIAQLEDGRMDGYRLNASCWGTYLHGILDNPDVLADLADGFDAPTGAPFDYDAYKEEQYDRLAAWVRRHIDLAYIYRTATEGD